MLDYMHSYIPKSGLIIVDDEFINDVKFSSMVIEEVTLEKLLQSNADGRVLIRF